MARLLIEGYGPVANPEEMVTLRCDDTGSLVEAARHSDAVILTITAVASGLALLTTDPPLAATARFGMVTLAGRAAAPALALVQAFVARTLKD